MEITEKILIGNQTAFSAEYPTLPFEYAIENNFNTFEWFPDKKTSGMGWSECDIDAEMRRSIKQKATENNIRLTVHAPWWANTIESDARPHIVACIKFARDIGAELLNVHLYLEKGAEYFIDAVAPYIKQLSNYGLKLSLENTPKTSPDDFNKVFSIIKKDKSIDQNSIGMCFDIGHANLYKNSHNDYLGFFDQIADEVPIIHIHLHENYGDSDSHLTLFTGPSSENEDGIDGFCERLIKRKFSGSIIMEQWPHNPTLLNNARNKLYNILLNNKNDLSKPPIPTDNKPSGFSASTPDGSNTFVDSIINGDKSAISWREKLSFVYNLFFYNALSNDTDKLIYLSLYLRFIHTGKIVCGEDGSHYRPQHHANIAQKLYKRLIEITNPDNAFIIRKIYPFIPSFDHTFTNREPLTRIREIAHRNDIPRELKQEIKHTLQNKLHRCADPKDLVTSKSILKRITSSDANLPVEFVREFSIFHDELQEFFNAKPIETLLDSLLSSKNVKDTIPIKKFLTLKRKNKDKPQQYINLLDSLTLLRKHFIFKSTDNTSPLAQKLKLAEIGLEDYAYVAVSEFINKFCSSKNCFSLELSVQALQHILTNLNLSSIVSEECSAVESELGAWLSNLDLNNHTHLLRLKSTLDRCKRLANEFTENLLANYSNKVNKLGKAFNLRTDFIDTYCESEIRNNLVFQSSKLTANSLKFIRALANLSPWDVVVAGEASGRIVSVAAIDNLSESYQEPAILVVKSISGDEEIPAGVVGVVLGHQLPHLCHFGVRAQQAKIVFITADDDESFLKFKSLSGKLLSIRATPDVFTWSSISNISEINNIPSHCKQISISNTKLNPVLDLLTFDKLTITNCGRKAYTAKLLKELSNSENANFLAPSGFILPFGIMEENINSIPSVKAEYWSLVDRLENVQPSGLIEITKRLQHIITHIKIDTGLIQKVINSATPYKRLMVRSSSNCEDYDELSGAGLYNSVANVLPSKIEKAILDVWASLWSKQAVMSRKKYGIPQKEAHMAVLIQEMIIPEFSFIIHTVNPVNNNSREMYIELIVGLGEVLTSGAVQGVPYRMIYDKDSKDVKINTFSNFSKAVFPDPNGDFFHKTQDYSKVALSVSEVYRKELVCRLSQVGLCIENMFGKPQDIEGVIKNNNIYLVQSRSQQMSK